MTLRTLGGVLLVLIACTLNLTPFGLMAVALGTLCGVLMGASGRIS